MKINITGADSPQIGSIFINDICRGVQILTIDTIDRGVCLTDSGTGLPYKGVRYHPDARLITGDVLGLHDIVIALIPENRGEVEVNYYDSIMFHYKERIQFVLVDRHNYVVPNGSDTPTSKDGVVLYLNNLKKPLF